MSRLHLGIDLGGSAIKLGLVDVDSGRLAGAARSVPTPQPSTPQACIEAIRIVDAELGGQGGAGFAVPSVAKGGIAYTAANIDSSWIGANAAGLLSSAIGRPAVLLNDADAAGIAEMRFGGGRGLHGLVIMLTFGTGIGSAPFIDGRLVPNTEFGHVPLFGESAEKWAAARVKREQNLDWKGWATRVNDYLALMERLFWPDAFIFGGAISEDFSHYAPHLVSRATVRPAALGASAGVIGAALAAADL